jgi:hypothetical protein
MKPETKNIIANIALSTAGLGITAGFLLARQYKYLLVLLTLAIAAYLIIKGIDFAHERAIDQSNTQTMMMSLLQQQQDFYTKKIDYLLDRIQTGDPIVAHNLNVPPLKKQPGKQFMNFPTVDGVEVQEGPGGTI